MAYQLATRLLAHESAQRGFGLSATQDVHFTEVGLEVGMVGPRERDPIPGDLGGDFERDTPYCKELPHPWHEASMTACKLWCNTVD